MRIVIYNVNSFGGNYEYAKALYQTYKINEAVDSVELIIPANSQAAGDNIRPVLLPDIAPYKNKWIKKIYFVYRSFINPIRLYRILKKMESAVVIFNDYDQLTSFFWVPKFRSLKKKHFFSVVLHDPDRDKYLSFKWMAIASMNKVMSLMDVAFYHGYLPEKPYFKNECKKVEVPHGIYDRITPDENFLELLNKEKKQPYLLGMLGNIREEKNYELVLESMVALPDCQLLVAGAKASSEVPVDRYKKMIKDLGLTERVIWIERFLDERELHSAIASCDIIVMYYSETFQSQSGILNIIAPYKKKLLVSDTPSALQKTVSAYGVALSVPTDSKEEFIRGIRSLIIKDVSTFDKGWTDYMKEASWSTHVNIAINTFKQLQRSS